MKRIVLGTCLAFALMTPLMAQTATDDSSALFGDEAASAATATTATPAEPASDPAILAWKTESSFRLGVGVDPDHRDLTGPAKAPGFDQDAQISFTQKDVKVILRGTESWNATASGAEPSFKPRENHVVWTPGQFRFDGGWQIFSWGSADSINPTDVLNPRDYSVGFDAKKIPVFGFSSAWYAADGFSVEAVFLPITTPSRFPTPLESTLPSSLFAGQDFSGYPTVVPVAQASQVNSRPVATDLSGSTVGGRVRGTWGSTTAALSFVSGFDTFPTPVVHVSGSGSVPADSFYRVESVELVYDRQYKAGLDLKTIVDRFGLWLETGAQWSQGASFNSWDRRHPTVSWTTGTDFNFGEADRNYLNLQYFGQWVPGFDDSFGKDYPNGQPIDAMAGDPAAMLKFYQRALVNSMGSLTEGLTQGISVDLKFPTPDEVVTLDLKGAGSIPMLYDKTVETRYGSIAVSPELQLRPFDSFKITLGSNLAYSWVKPANGDLTLKREGDNVGGYTQDNLVTLSATYQWAGDIKR